MNIRTKLTLRFTWIVALMAMAFSIAIYYFSATYRKHEFYERLKEKALNYSQLLIKLDDINEGLLELVDKNTAYLPNERIIVLGDDNKELFNTYKDSHPIPTEIIAKVRKQKEIRYEENNNEVLGILYTNKTQVFVVIVSALDTEGLNKLENLKIILVVGFVAFLIATLIFGRLFAKQALSPISNVIKEVESITASNLTKRVNEGNGTDEIAQLAVTFNQMLNRIQQAFELQKSFVSNSSHELRTPLTSITGQIEVALMNSREPEEYQAVLHSLLDDIKNVNRLTNGLLELAQANLDISKLKMKEVRMDELLWLTRNDLLKRNPDYKINIEILDLPEDESQLQILGSEQLLRSALINLMDNACKFSSNHQVNIQFKSQGGAINISFRDLGIGISEEDLKNINQPFYRGTNAKSFAGHGLGLSLTSKIIDLHKGEMHISSKLNEFTEVNVRFDLGQTD